MADIFLQNKENVTINKQQHLLKKLKFAPLAPLRQAPFYIKLYTNTLLYMIFLK